jgi:hypothetical protein
MTPPRWFWFVLAACVLAVTGFYCWNVWHDNQGQPEASEAKRLRYGSQPEPTPAERKAMEDDARKIDEALKRN